MYKIEGVTFGSIQDVFALRREHAFIVQEEEEAEEEEEEEEQELIDQFLSLWGEE